MWDNVEKSFMRGKINMIDKELDHGKKITICASLVRHSQSLKLDPIMYIFFHEPFAPFWDPGME